MPAKRRGQTVRVLISLSADELEAIDAAAAAAGLDRSSYLRSVALRDARKQKDAPAQSPVLSSPKTMLGLLKRFPMSPPGVDPTDPRAKLWHDAIATLEHLLLQT